MCLSCFHLRERSKRIICALTALGDENVITKLTTLALKVYENEFSSLSMEMKIQKTCFYLY